MDFTTVTVAPMRPCSVTLSLTQPLMADSWALRVSRKKVSVRPTTYCQEAFYLSQIVSFQQFGQGFL